MTTNFEMELTFRHEKLVTNLVDLSLLKKVYTVRPINLDLARFDVFSDTDL